MAELQSNQDCIVIDEIEPEENLDDSQECILVENKDITTIQIDDTIIANGSEDGELGSDNNDPADEIDLTICSQENPSSPPADIAEISDESNLVTFNYAFIMQSITSNIIVLGFNKSNRRYRAKTRQHYFESRPE